MTTSVLKSVELFAGAGGLALGVARAGFQHEAVIEYNRHASRTLQLNQAHQLRHVAEWPLHQCDVQEFDYSTLNKPIQLVSGGPPCQPFSIGGKHRGRSDKRDMFPEAVRAVRELQPAVFVFENVKGLLRKSFSEYFEYIILQLTYPEVVRQVNESWVSHLARLQKCGLLCQNGKLTYNVEFRLLNSANYGVPQKRERVFIVGFRRDLEIEWSFPTPTHSREELIRSKWVTGEYWEKHRIAKSKRAAAPPKLHKKIAKMRRSPPLPLFNRHEKRWITVRDAIGDLPEPIVNQSPPGISNHQLRLGAKIYPGHTGSLIDEPAKTLKAGDHGVPGGENMVRYHDGSVRYFTIKESARLQTFPDDYLIHGSWTESMRQLGNAVPVTLAEIVARSLYQSLHRHLVPTSN